MIPRTAHADAQMHTAAAADPTAAGDGQPEPLLGSIDLHPIIAFERQESDDLDRLLTEHHAKEEERLQLLDLLRDTA